MLLDKKYLLTYPSNQNQKQTHYPTQNRIIKTYINKPGKNFKLKTAKEGEG